MGLFEKWPYTNFHDLNLDWILRKVKNVDDKLGSVDAAVLEAQQAALSANGSAMSAESSASDAQAAAESIASGSPVVVTTAAQMTDTSLIYLYMGSETGYNSGEWYYYDGSEWLSGGVYGSGMITSAARSLLEYILKRAIYNDQGTYNYIDALVEALKRNGSPTVFFSVSYNLSHSTSSNTDTDIISGSSYTSTITADTGYYVESIAVSMNGVDITSTAVSGRTINIAEITGNIIITAVTSGPWTNVWDYTMGLPENNGFTKEQAGTATITETADGLRLVLPSTAGYMVRYKYDMAAYTTPASRMVSEVKFRVNSWSSQTSAGVRCYAGLGGSTPVKCLELLISDNTEQQGLSWLATASGWSSLSSDVPAVNVDHTCKLVQVPGSCQVYIDGVLIDTITDFREAVTAPQTTINREMDVYLLSYKVYVEA